MVLTLKDSVIVLCFVVRYSFAITLMGEERASCFALFVFLVSRDCCVPRVCLQFVIVAFLSTLTYFFIILTYYIPNCNILLLSRLDQALLGRKLQKQGSRDKAPTKQQWLSHNYIANCRS